jgi:hypothetical protein
MGIIMKGRKKGIIDKRQRNQIEENRKLISEAAHAIWSKGEEPNIPKISQYLAQNKKRLKINTIPTNPTIYRYLKELKEKRDRQHREENAAFPAFIGGLTIDDFIERMEPITKEMARRWENMGLLNCMLHKNLPFKIRERTSILDPFYRRKVTQLEKSLKIETSTNQNKFFFEKEFQHQLMVPIMMFFYTYFFDSGINELPENTKCKINLTFDAFKGKLAFLENQITWNEWRLANGRWTEYPTCGESFEEILYQLLEDHVEHYRMTSIKNKNFNVNDYKIFRKKVFDFTKRRILKRLDEEKLHTKLKKDPRKLHRFYDTPIDKKRLEDLFNIFAQRKKETIEKD